MLRYSRFLSVDVTLTQQKPEFYGSIDKAYRDFGGCPTISVTDNLTPAVTKASKNGDADLNPDYAFFCEHYGTVAIPAGPKKPTHKDGIE
ncbi:transposase, partial [mine drainage metagenome]